MYGGDRDFYPNTQNVFGDSRPDSTGYNHGYTDVNPVSYSKLQKTLLHITLSFHRILFCQKETRRSFQCLQRPQGFNYRDYGVEFGPIIKLIGIKNILLSIHPTGVLAIGVDDRTLVAEAMYLLILLKL
jgi:hypothetical protein